MHKKTAMRMDRFLRPLILRTLRPSFMPPHPHSRLWRTGFTLLELLVSISVIALMAGILVPVLGRAKRSARCLQSQANLRQLHTMTELYKNDHKNLFPKPAEGTFRGNGDMGSDKRVEVLWYNAVDPYGGLNPPTTVAERQNRNDAPWKQSAAWAVITPDRQGANRTFKMNAHFADDNAGRYQTQENQVRHPSDTVLYGDGQAEDMDGQTSIGNASNFSMTEGIVGPRNPGRTVNIAFVDGHVSAEFQKLKEKVGSTVYPCPGWYSETDKAGGKDRTLVWDFTKR